MIYAKKIVLGLNRSHSGHFQNTPNIKTFFGYAAVTKKGTVKRQISIELKVIDGKGQLNSLGLESF